jgi:hypothetical protein
MGNEKGIVMTKKLFFIVFAAAFLPMSLFADESKEQDIPYYITAKDGIYIMDRYVKTMKDKHDELVNNNAGKLEDVTFIFYYNTDGNPECLYTIVDANGYRWNAQNKKWTLLTSGTKSPVTNYSGDKFYWPSLEQRDKNKIAWMKRMNDPAFKSIEAVVYQLGLDFDYDWNSFSGNNYGRVRYESPNTTHAVCEGFADELTKRLRGNQFIDHIEKWSYPGHHAWNVLVLKDGRRLYCDATWYEGNRVKNGIVPYGCEQEPEQLTFDADEFNSHGFCTTPSGGLLKIHGNWPGVEMEIVR